MSKKELFNELASKIQSSKQEERGYQTIIEEIKNLDPTEAQNKLTEELNNLSNQAQNFEKQSKWREASISWYKGAMIVQAYAQANDNSVAAQWFLKASEGLVKLSQEYMTWKEINRASAAISISSILYFLIDDWTLKPFYNEFNNQFQNEIQGSNIASQSLLVPHDLVKGVQELDSELLQRAESYTQTALLTETKISDAFRDGIQTAINKARKAMVSQMKVPNLQSSSTLPNNLIFGDEFVLSINLTNKGEGDARNVDIQINLPQNLKILDGQSNITIPHLNSNQSYKFEIKCTCIAMQGVDNLKINIDGKVSYFDTLNNQRESPLGPYQMVVRSFRKSDELKELITQIENDNDSILDELKDLDTKLANSFLSTYQTLKNEIDQFIEKEEFAQAEARIELTKVLLSNIAKEASQLISNHEKLNQKLSDELTNSVKVLQATKNKLNETEKLLIDFEQQWLS